jgi:homoserine O-succinyltransferase/O-acetyltransferase
MQPSANRQSAAGAEGVALQAIGTVLENTCDDAIEIAFVNNMPDQAVKTTQAQFTRIIEAGAGNLPFRLHCYTLPGVSRSDETRRFLLQSHCDIGELYARGADALIVTGTEPRAALLTDEPYWAEFVRLVDWARSHTFATIWSCLAAHVVVQHLDGIARRRATKKFSGVYAFNSSGGNWPTRGTGPQVLVPHSRYNGISLDDLERCGYNISAWSEAVGVDTFWRREPSYFLFLQGHPEYNADTLSREYRRDVIRFLNGEGDTYPCVPDNYFSPRTQERLESLRERALAQRYSGCEEALDEILFSETLDLRWSGHAAQLYRNWLAVVAMEKNRAASRLCGGMKPARACSSR